MYSGGQLSIIEIFEVEVTIWVDMVSVRCSGTRLRIPEPHPLSRGLVAVFSFQISLRQSLSNANAAAMRQSYTQFRTHLLYVFAPPFNHHHRHPRYRPCDTGAVTVRMCIRRRPSYSSRTSIPIKNRTSSVFTHSSVFSVLGDRSVEPLSAHGRNLG